MRSFAKIFSAVLLTAVLFTACGKAEEAVDLSDIPDMNIGAEMPFILYCSEEKIIMDGTFGIIVYDFENGKITDRISADEIHEMNMVGFANFASADGNTIFLTDMIQISGEVNNVVAYDIESRTASPAEPYGSGEQLDRFKTKPYDPAEYKKYFAEGYIIGVDPVPLENEFVYLRSSDWDMKNLEIAVCDYGGGEKIYRVFDGVTSSQQ